MFAIQLPSSFAEWNSSDVINEESKREKDFSPKGLTKDRCGEKSKSERVNVLSFHCALYLSVCVCVCASRIFLSEQREGNLGFCMYERGNGNTVIRERKSTLKDKKV